MFSSCIPFIGKKVLGNIYSRCWRSSILRFYIWFLWGRDGSKLLENSSNLLKRSLQCYWSRNWLIFICCRARVGTLFSLSGISVFCISHKLSDIISVFSNGGGNPLIIIRRIILIRICTCIHHLWVISRAFLIIYQFNFSGRNFLGRNFWYSVSSML